VPGKDLFQFLKPLLSFYRPKLLAMLPIKQPPPPPTPPPSEDFPVPVSARVNGRLDPI